MLEKIIKKIKEIEKKNKIMYKELMELKGEEWKEKVLYSRNVCFDYSDSDNYTRIRHDIKCGNEDFEQKLKECKKMNNVNEIKDYLLAFAKWLDIKEQVKYIKYIIT